jgi:hypothetical protein
MSFPMSPRDRADLAVADLITSVLYSVERTGQLGAFSATQLAEWLRIRTASFCAHRAAGLERDDTPIEIATGKREPWRAQRKSLSPL